MLEIKTRVGGNRVFVLRASTRVAALNGVLLMVATGVGIRGGPARSAEEPESNQQATEEKMAVGGKLPLEILTALEDVYSVQAELRFQADILGKKWEGRGTYAEVRSGPIPKSRLDLHSGLTGVEKRLLQVCDGATVWLHDGIENSGRVVKTDAARCHELMNATGKARTMNGLGLSGIAGLLRALDSMFYFDSIAEEAAPPRRENQSIREKGTIGTLRRSVASRILDDRAEGSKSEKTSGKSEPAQWKRLPPMMPTHVVLRFGPNSPIPNAVEYYRMAPGSSESRRLLRLVFEKVRFNKRVEESLFSFSPPKGVEILDNTDAVLETH
jgi:hypothetical protein